ncbi:hypothetical protein HRR78_004056 [Exophiala dermatitidis]|nr:hypothetical protein HRR78_004056 [Exophiala dermatitidis]
MSHPRFLIFGTGSIGAVYAYIFSRAVTPANVFTVCRSNYDVVAKQGFTINSTIFGQNLNVRPQVVRSVEEAVTKSDKPFDYVIVTAKAIPSTPSIPDQIRRAISPNTTIALIQNGIGIVTHKEIELLHLGTYPATAPQSHKESAERFGALLQAGGASFKVHDDVQQERWSKLLVNATWNPICALSRSRDAQFIQSSSYAPNLIQDVMLEISAIAQAAGYPSVSRSVVESQIGRATARPLPGVEPSMLADAAAGRNMEVDAIVGNALRIAEEKGVDTPLLRAVYALVKALDGSFTHAREQSSQ